MRSLGSLLGVFGLILAGAGCGGDGGPTGPVTVGLLAPKTGALTKVGESFERIALVAVDNINSKGGIDGRDLKLIIADTETVADTAGAKLQELVDQGAIAVVGPATSGEVSNAVDAARESKVPIISPSSTAASLSRPAPIGPDDQGYMFRNVPDDEIQGIAMAYYLKTLRQPAVDNVVVMYENSPYGTGLKDAFKTAFENFQGTVANTVAFTQNLADVAAANTEITKLVNLTPQPTVVVLIAVEQDVIKLMQAWDNNGSPRVANMEFFMTDGARSSGVLTGAPASVHGMCGTAPTFPVNGLAYRYLQDAYEQSYTDKLSDQVFGPNVWDAFHVLAAALVQQKRKYPGDELGGQHLRDSITTISRDGQTFHSGQWRDLVIALRAGNDVDYDGAAGPNDLDVNGQAVGPYEVWCISADGTTFNQKLFLDAADIQASVKP